MGKNKFSCHKIESFPSSHPSNLNLTSRNERGLGGSVLRRESTNRYEVHVASALRTDRVVDVGRRVMIFTSLLAVFDGSEIDTLDQVDGRCTCFTCSCFGGHYCSRFLKHGPTTPSGVSPFNSHWQLNQNYVIIDQ